MSSDETIIKYAIKSLADELQSTVIYSKLAELYKGKPISEKLFKIAKMENEHVMFWLNFLRKRGFHIEKPSVSKLRILILVTLFKMLGIGLTLRILEMDEREAASLYSTMLESSNLSLEEEQIIKRVLEDELIHEYEFVEEESKFKDFMNHVRDSVLGMNDGLVEVLSVSAGLAGAYGNPFSVAMGGAIVGIAGALSMGVGAFASVKAQRQVRLSFISRIKFVSKYVAHVFVSRLASYMRKKGLSKKAAQVVSSEAAKNKELLSRIIAEEEYGLREESLEDPIRAGLYTGFFYIIGAIVPLIPYFLNLPIILAIPLSFVFAALMLAFTGFIIAVSANLNIKKKMLELIIAGLGSAMITYSIGKLASILLGISVD